MRRALQVVYVALVLAAVVSLPADAQDPGVLPYPPAPVADDATATALARVDAAEDRRARAQEELSALSGRRTTSRAQLRQRIRALYQLSQAGALAASGGLDGVLAHLGRTQRLARVVRHEAAGVESLRRRADALRTEVAAATAEAAQARTDLEAAEARRSALALPALAPDGMAQGVTASPDYGTIQYAAASAEPEYGTIRVVDDGAPIESFAAMRGTLELPVAGDMRVDDVDGHAVALSAQPGSAVRAVAEGRVVFADERDGWGRLVILDHGGRYFSVYGGLAATELHPGDRIPRGARVGTLASRPLRFEVRHGATSLAAREWLGI